MKKLIAYYRVSTDRQGRSGLGLDAQRQIVEEYASQRGAVVLEDYTDIQSGRSQDRPELANALAAARRHGAAIVVAKLDRLARSVPDARAIGDSLAERGVKLQIAGSVHDPTDPMGKLFFNILATFAEFESDLIRHRTREGMAVVYDDVHVGGKGPRAVAVQPAGAAATAAPGPRSSGATRNGARPAASKAPAPPSTTRTTRTPRTAARPLARAHAGSGRPAAGAGLAYTLMVLWAGMVAWGVWTQRLPLWVLGALAALNVLTLWVYAADKNAAQSGGWRTSENNLHTLGLLGGWPAAWLAQQSMRHKSSKAAFRTMYWITILLHCVALGAWVSGWLGIGVLLLLIVMVFISSPWMLVTRHIAGW